MVGPSLFDFRARHPIATALLRAANNPAAGHYGNGAVLGFGDPDGHISFAYVCNRAGRSWRDPRNIALVDARTTRVGSGSAARMG